MPKQKRGVLKPNNAAFLCLVETGNLLLSPIFCHYQKQLPVFKLQLALLRTSPV